MTRVLIYCAGKGRRWGNYNGLPKHLTVVNGEVLLDRILRQIKEREECEIVIIGPEGDDRYVKEGTLLEHVNVMDCPDDNIKEAPDKCLNSSHLWSDTDRTICILGDVWFEDSAMDEIFKERIHTFIVFARMCCSLITGKRWGEDFASSLWPENRESVIEHLKTFHEGTSSPWRHVIVEFQKSDTCPHWVELGGFTEDFDSPQHLIEWYQMRNKYEEEMSSFETVTVGGFKEKESFDTLQDAIPSDRIEL